MAQNNEISRPNTPAMEYCIEQIKQSGKPGSEVVIGAMALWIAAHGDFELPHSIPTHDSVAVDNKQPDEKSDSDNILDIRPVSFVRLPDAAESSHIEVINSTDLERTPLLNAELQEIFLPLVMAAKMKVPTDDEKWYEKVKPGNKKHYPWTYSQVVDNKMLHYYFDLEYFKSKNKTELSQLKILFGGKEIKDNYFGHNANDFTITVDFEKDSIKSFSVYDYSCENGYFNSPLRELVKSDVTVEPINSDGMINAKWDEDILGGMVHSTINYPADKKYYPSHSLRLSPAEINFVNEFNTSIVSRAYDADSEKFVSTKINHTGEIFGRNMESVQIKQVAQAFMNLIPLRETQL